jgi:hypothetical protein
MSPTDAPGWKGAIAGSPHFGVRIYFVPLIERGCSRSHEAGTKQDVHKQCELKRISATEDIADRGADQDQRRDSWLG